MWEVTAESKAARQLPRVAEGVMERQGQGLGLGQGQETARAKDGIDRR